MGGGVTGGGHIMTEESLAFSSQFGKSEAMFCLFVTVSGRQGACSLICGSRWIQMGGGRPAEAVLELRPLAEHVLIHEGKNVPRKEKSPFQAPVKLFCNSLSSMTDEETKAQRRLVIFVNHHVSGKYQNLDLNLGPHTPLPTYSPLANRQQRIMQVNGSISHGNTRTLTITANDKNRSDSSH